MKKAEPPIISTYQLTQKNKKTRRKNDQQT